MPNTTEARPGVHPRGSGPFLVDLHNHTAFSSDGVLDPHSLLWAARSRGIHCLGVTDHNTLRGGLACARLAATDPGLPRVLPGVEIATAQGDLVGFFVEEDIPRGLDMEETVGRIRAQGGVVYLPHPCDSVRRSSVVAEVRERVAPLCDIIEVANGRALVPDHEEQALRLAARAGCLIGAGSDAHYGAEVGRVYVEARAIPTRDDLLETLRTARPGGWSGTRQVGAAWVFCLGTGLSKARAASWRALTSSLRRGAGGNNYL